MLNGDDAGSNEYKEGWNSAVAYINDNYQITQRNGEPIAIVFNANINQKDLEEKIRGAQDG